MNVVLKCIALGLITLIAARFLHLCASTCSQLFTHCLLTIICVMLMSIVFLSFLLFWIVCFFSVKIVCHPCISCILCFCVKFVPDSFVTFGSMALCIWVFYNPFVLSKIAG